MRDGEWLVGHGVAANFRNNLPPPSGAQVHLEQNGTVTVETDMTDIGTGSYTILLVTRRRKCLAYRWSRLRFTSAIPVSGFLRVLVDNGREGPPPP
ncbi:molybdopterin-dependent oxidoreductase [Escherichia coli]|nr:molybdopterin-dependent oxidoreductase [Escherichia coli]